MPPGLPSSDCIGSVPPVPGAFRTRRAARHMDRRIIFPLVAASAIVFACGPRPHASGERFSAVRLAGAAHVSASPRLGKPAHPARAHRIPRAPVIDAELSVRTENGVRFSLAVTNTSDHRVEVAFPDGRTRDFAVFDVAGREVWRWSHGRLFTQGMQATLIAPGDSVVYAERWTPSVPGRYTLVAQLRSENFPITRQASFVVGSDSTQPPAALP